MLVWTIIAAVAAVAAAILALLAYVRANARRRLRDERDVKAYGLLEAALRKALVLAEVVVGGNTESWSMTVSKFRSSLVAVQALFVDLAEDLRPRRAGRLIRKLADLRAWIQRLDATKDPASAQAVASEALPDLRAAHKLAKRRAK